MKAFTLFLLLASCGTLRSAEVVNDLVEAVRKLAPGVVVEIADGVYQTSKPVRIEGMRGTAKSPVVLRAQHRGKAVIRGAAGFIIRDCEHLVLEGFAFEHDAHEHAAFLDNCHHVRVTRNVFRLKERAKPEHWEHWVSINGARSGDNRVDHNRFERKVNRGSHVFVRGDDTALLCSQHDRVDHNHFRDVIFADKENGHETIRTGGNDLGAASRASFTIIEDNLLERCSGEDELMSLKSSDNLVRRNTLIDCRGAICLRLGNRSTVSGNFIIATKDGSGFGGVKLFGFEHQVFNNVFIGLTGTRHEAPLALVPGLYDTPTTENIGKKYDDATAVPPTRCWIGFNTWIDCSPLLFGFEKEDSRWRHLPHNNTFTNNLVVHTKPMKTPLVIHGRMRAFHAANNLAHTVGDAPDQPWASWFRWIGLPFESKTEGPDLWRLSSSSEAIDAAASASVKISDDVFGRGRSGALDVGAEEHSPQVPKHRLLTSEDVGPDAEEAQSGA